MITRNFFAWNPIHKDHATLARSVKGSYMNCSALMNLMEVKMDQIQGKLNSLQAFPLTTWLTSVVWVQMELSLTPVKSDGTTIPTTILHCLCFPLRHIAQLVSHALHPSLLTPTTAVLRKRKASRSVVTSEGSEGESDCEGDQDNGVTTDAATDMDHETDIDGITPSEPASQ
ncbi:uncharacterized protein EDB93DRAFT_1107804 [Suillus bovinus]|uniref:uncharacterized protein n=1 Tax=Suillus bovinus TaxID=48563 RepID=UPI001B8602E5|nr:uncharacterized protein EDB93DRAFT_1107804 [Suillus bovinus]KAG2132726.1 hypothetical protein EDB93DRAFT_1107804 [Suillus bovinus]